MAIFSHPPARHRFLGQMVIAYKTFLVFYTRYWRHDFQFQRIAFHKRAVVTEFSGLLDPQGPVWGRGGLTPLFLNQWEENNACSNDEEQEGKEWQVRTKGTARPVGQRHDAQDDGEAAHLDAVEVAGTIESQHDQPHPNEPGVFRDPPLGHEPESSDHDQEERPADSL